MIWFGYLLVGIALISLMPVAVFSAQVFAATLFNASRDKTQNQVEGKAPETCILMPAHNEALCIRNILQQLLPMLSDNMRLLVVADNCSDNTASIVRELAGNRNDVVVLERHNARHRGKGYALDFGVRHLEANPPQVVIIMDADCVFSDGAPSILAAQCMRYSRPVQALYLMEHLLDSPSLKAKFAQFAWVVKNQVRALGDLRMGLPCLLMGTGMAFPWPLISQAQLGTSHIVEDMKLGLEMTEAGHPPLFYPSARVSSHFPVVAEGVHMQRTRWEHGHLGVIISDVPRAVWRSYVARNPPLLAMALNLSVPPLALLTFLLASLLFTSAALGFSAGFWAPAFIAIVSVVTLSGAVISAWWSYGRDIISLRQLCCVPWYVISKVPVYFYFLIKRQTQWIRSSRRHD